MAETMSREPLAQNPEQKELVPYQGRLNCQGSVEVSDAPDKLH